MNELDTLIADIVKLGTNYEPGEKTKQHLSTKTIIPIIGPTAIGKNTVMETILRRDEDFGRSVGFTTREQREGESPDTYTFIPHTTGQLSRIKQRLENKELVQVAVFPTTGMIYGSGPEDYEAPFTVIDFLASSMNDLVPLGFKKIQPIALVSPVAEWKHWLRERLGEVSPEEFRKRLREAETSLQWVINHAKELHVQLNYAGDSLRTAREIIDVCKGGTASNEHLPKANEMLTHVQSLLSEN